MSFYSSLFRIGIILLLVFSNCLLFEPKLKTVPEAYVREEVMSDEQKNASKVIKQKVIAIKNEINLQKKSNEITAQSNRISKAKIAKHTSSRDLAKEREKLALIKDDSLNAKRYLDETQAADLEKSKEETRFQAWIQREKEDRASLQMKEAMLSEAIAELELVRAEVAIKYQESQGKTSKDEDYVSKDKYDKQYTASKTESRRKTSEWEKVKNQATVLPKVNMEDTYSDDIN